MNEWKDNHEIPLEKHGGICFKYEIRYYDRYGVTRTAEGHNLPPFGVGVDGVDGSMFPDAAITAFNERSTSIPYGRIKAWRKIE